MKTRLHVTSRYQYRVTVNGNTGDIVDTLPSERWENIAQVMEDRGGLATLERRIVTNASILPMLASMDGWTVLPDGVVVGPWYILAQLNL
jgi:hypothetical protein